MNAVVHSLRSSLFWSSCILTSRNNYCLITHREKNTRRMYSTLLRRISLELERIFDFGWKRNLLGRVLAAVNLFSFLAHTGALMRWSLVKIDFPNLQLYLQSISRTWRAKINLFLRPTAQLFFVYFGGVYVSLSSLKLISISISIDCAKGNRRGQRYTHESFLPTHTISLNHIGRCG